MMYVEFWKTIRATQSRDTKKDSLRKLRDFWMQDSGRKYKEYVERGTLEYMANKRRKGNL